MIMLSIEKIEIWCSHVIYWFNNHDSIKQGW